MAGNLAGLMSWNNGNFHIDGYLQSVSVENNDINNKTIITEVWRFTAYIDEVIVEEPPSTTPAQIIALDVSTDEWKSTLIRAELVPYHGFLYEDWIGKRVLTGNASGTLLDQPCDTGLESARCEGYQISTDSRGDVIMTVRFGTYYRVKYTNYWGPQYNYLPADEEKLLPAQVEVSGGRREMMMYRRNWTIPPSATVDKTPADIGGDPAIVGGEKGIPIDVPQARVRLRIIKDTYTCAMNEIIPQVILAQGKRNETQFLDFPAQTLVLENVQVVKLEGSYYELVFDFVWDKYYECSQVPEYDIDGKVKMDNNGVNLADVRWMRIERDLYEFNDFFFRTFSDFNAATPIQWDEQKEYAQKGYW